jgi:hypothetical protein
MRNIISIYNMAYSNDLPHLTKKLKNKFIPPILSATTISTTTCGAPQTFPQP